MGDVVDARHIFAARRADKESRESSSDSSFINPKKLTDLFLILAKLRTNSGPTSAEVAGTNQRVVSEYTQEQLFAAVNDFQENQIPTKRPFYEAVIAELYRRDLMPSSLERDT